MGSSGSGAEGRPQARSASVERYLAVALLVLVGAGLAAGALAHLAGSGAAGEEVWAGTGALGAAYALWSVIEGVRRSELGVDAIALLAVVGALAVGQSLAAAVVALMLVSGRSLESWADGRARRDLQLLLERAPRTARRHERGELVTVPVDDVAVGDLLMVGSGEIVPVDGNLTGPAVLDESALTGEPLPVERTRGDAVRSGVVNAGKPFDLRATTGAADSTYAGVVGLVSAASSSRPRFVQLADRYAVGFLGVSLVAAALAWVAGGATRAVAVLVVATPCPLILAAPVAFVSGLSKAAQRGVVVKGAGALERLARCTRLLFDKTGTLTAGRPELQSVVTADASTPEEVLFLAASVDQMSSHVLATAVVRAALERGCELAVPTDVEESPGQGVRGRLERGRVAVGSASWATVSSTPAWARPARRKALAQGALTVYVSVDDEPVGVLTFADPLRVDAARAVRLLRRSGFERLVMVTGDRQEVAEAVGAVVGLDGVVAERSPAEKLEVVRAERVGGPTVMVGDGINDAPALALADVGVAMGARGRTVSTEAADVVLTVDRLDRLVEARAIAARTRRIALQSVVAGMALSAAAMVAAGFGEVPPVWGALLQEAIDVAVIVNALRALRGAVAGVRLETRGSELARRFAGEHAEVRSVAERVRVVADSIGVPGCPETADALAEVRAVHQELVDVVMPHERAEEAELYPVLDRAIGGANPTEPMSRGHAEIEHQVRLLGQFLADVDPGLCDDEDLVELRRILYGLAAVLLLHTAQEEESYLSLAEEHVPASRAAGA